MQGKKLAAIILGLEEKTRIGKYSIVQFGLYPHTSNKCCICDVDTAASTVPFNS